MLLEAFKGMLEPACDVVGAVTDGHALVEAAALLEPDVIVADVSMPHLNGLDACERVRQQLPRVKIVFLTMNADPDTAAAAFRRGASGYVLKSSASRELFEAISRAMQGDTYVTPSITTDPLGVFVARAPLGSDRGLTLRQRQVLQLLAEGRSMKEAADVLKVTPRTIAFHKYSMMAHLGFRTTAELVQHAVALGLVARK